MKEDYVSFKLAKLLKEKGFAEPCIGFYDPVKGYFFESCIRKVWDYNKHGSINAPTLQMAMKWLREEKHIYIQIMLDSFACGGSLGYYVVLQKTDSDYERMLSDFVEEIVFYKTYEEAAESAIKYCLTNLI